ncbi:S8 family serine peptidase [Nocardiopsis coralliicola]
MAQLSKRNRGRIGAGACAVALLAPAAAPAAADAAQDETPPPLASIPSQPVGGTCAPASDDIVDQQVWTENALGLPRARTVTEGAGTTVAILGSGVDDTAKALSGAVRGAGEDCHGLGTFLAGVVAARPQPGSGLVGVAPAADILSVPVTDDAGWADAADLAEGLTTAAGQDADVILIAVAMIEESAALDAAVDKAVAADAVVIAPASYPERGAGHYSVPGDRDDVLAATGTGPDGQNTDGPSPKDLGAAEGQPDIAAPGAAVMSLAPGGDGHAVSSGDPVAGAFVAGTAALVRAQFPDLSAEETAERLAATAYPAAESARLGAGTVDPVGAVGRSAVAAESAVAPQAPALSPPLEPTVGRVMALVGATALLGVIAAVGAAAVRRRRAPGAG